MNTDIKVVKDIVEDVFQSIGYGVDYRFYEAYQEAIGVGLRLAGIKYEKRKSIEITYKGHCVGEYQVDFLVHLAKENVVVHTDYYFDKLKNVSYYDDQIKRCMQALGAKIGLLVLYGKSSPKNIEQPKLTIRELGL
jgi:GxxExxY protein